VTKTLGKFVARAVVVPTLLLGVTLAAIAMSVSVSGGVSHHYSLAADGGSGVLTAQDQSASVTENSSVVISAADFSAGYTDSDPNPSLTCCTVQLVDGTGPSDGTVTADANGDGGYTYQPTSGYTGTDSFQFTLTDSDGNVSDPVAVTVDVTPALTASPANYEALSNTALNLPPGTLLNGSGDANSDASSSCCTAQLETTTADGSLSLASTGGFSYTPDSGFNGTDSFTYELTDTDGDVSAPATVTIDVGGAGYKTDTSMVSEEPPAASPTTTVTFIASVLRVNGQQTPAGGTVSFTWYRTGGEAGGGPKSGSFGTVALNGEYATLTTSHLDAAAVNGAEIITATYNGDSNDGTSEGQIQYYVESSCAETVWPTETDGLPKLASNGTDTPNGYFIGQSNGWFSVYVSEHAASQVSFTGTIGTPGLILDASPTKNKPGDSFKVSGGGKLVFTMQSRAGLDGFQFFAGCGTTLSFNLYMGGKPASSRRILLGSAKTQASSNPFTLHRGG
jgi:hypothetical protein